MVPGEVQGDEMRDHLVAVGDPRPRLRRDLQWTFQAVFHRVRFLLWTQGQDSILRACKTGCNQRVATIETVFRVFSRSDYRIHGRAVMDEIEQFLNPGWLLAQPMQDLLEDGAVKITFVDGSFTRVFPAQVEAEIEDAFYICVLAGGTSRWSSRALRSQ